jgi:hypothetical protein
MGLAKWEAHRFQPTTLDKLEEQILYALILFPVKFSSKSVATWSSSFQKGAQCSDTCECI